MGARRTARWGARVVRSQPSGMEHADGRGGGLCCARRAAAAPSVPRRGTARPSQPASPRSDQPGGHLYRGGDRIRPVGRVRVVAYRQMADGSRRHPHQSAASRRGWAATATAGCHALCGRTRTPATGSAAVPRARREPARCLSVVHLRHGACRRGPEVPGRRRLCGSRNTHSREPCKLPQASCRTPSTASRVGFPKRQKSTWAVLEPVSGGP